MTIPSLKGARTAIAELDSLARSDAAARGLPKTGPNEYSTPAGTQRLVDAYHAKRHVRASFGGYGERRGFLWRTTYLDGMKDPTHIGVDVNVPAGTRVVSYKGGTVVWTGTDHPEQHGWGNRVIVRLHNHPIWMIYAHLGDRLRCSIDQVLAPNGVIGEVGSPTQNGGWFPHLHLQAMTEEAWEMFKKDPRSIDGYCPHAAWPRWRELCPDPLRFIKVP